MQQMFNYPGSELCTLAAVSYLVGVSRHYQHTQAISCHRSRKYTT